MGTNRELPPGGEHPQHPSPKIDSAHNRSQGGDSRELIALLGALNKTLTTQNQILVELLRTLQSTAPSPQSRIPLAEKSAQPVRLPLRQAVRENAPAILIGLAMGAIAIAITLMLFLRG